MRRQHMERDIHSQIVATLKWALPHAWIVRTDRGNPRNRIQGAIEKGMGSVKGWPDIEIIGLDADARPATWHIEVKSKSGSVKPEQHAVHDMLRDLGRPVGIAKSVDDALRLGREWGWPLRISDQFAFPVRVR